MRDVIIDFCPQFGLCHPEKIEIRTCNRVGFQRPRQSIAFHQSAPSKIDQNRHFLQKAA